MKCQSSVCIIYSQRVQWYSFPTLVHTHKISLADGRKISKVGKGEVNVNLMGALSQ